MKRLAWRNSLILVMAMALLVAACGNGGSTTTTAAAGGEDTTTTAPSGPDEITWISPRGTLEVMDDYNMWVAIEMGYFDEMGIEVTMEPGPADSTAPTKFVAERQADVGYPAPAVLLSSIEAGMEVISIFNVVPRQVFNFAVQEGSDIKTLEDLRGKTISLWASGGQVVSDPILAGVGISADEVTYVEGGAQWGAIVAQGQADAAMGWDGLRAQWAAQGLALDWILGRDYSDHPSNVYSVRTEDLETEEGRDMWTRFLKAQIMGLEFTRHNPRAAAQITFSYLNDLPNTVEPELALASMLELAEAYSTSVRAGQGWGYHYPDGWESYIATVVELGQVGEIDPSRVFTNDLLEAANDFDLARVKADAEGFELDDVFGNIDVPSGYDF